MSARLYLYKKQGGKCHYCRKQMTKRPVGPHHATEDHIIPRAQGGASSFANLVGACFKCNNMRGNIPYSTFKEFIETHGNTQSIAEVLRGLTPAQYQSRKYMYDTVKLYWGGKKGPHFMAEEVVKTPTAQKTYRRPYLHVTRRNIESIIVGIPYAKIKKYIKEGMTND